LNETGDYLKGLSSWSLKPSFIQAVWLQEPWAGIRVPILPEGDPVALKGMKTGSGHNEICF